MQNLENRIRPYFTQPGINLSPDLDLDNFIALSERFNNSGINSIDKFLALNPEFAYIGKIAIALEILEAESQSKFYEVMDPERKGQDWYSFLYNRMLEVVPSEGNSHLHFARNEISFITFNYDRSLEFFLHRCFKNTFNANIFKANKINDLIPFPFFNVYGAAKLPWQVESQHDASIEYEGNIKDGFIKPGDIKTMAESLKIIGQDRLKNPEILEMINSADRVFFLGFGFADENLDILNIPDTIKDKRVFGTAKGLTDREMQRVIAKLYPGNRIVKPGDRLIKKGPVTLAKVDCLMLLREYL